MSTANPNIHEIVTFPIDVSYPEVKPLSLHLEFPAGRLTVNAGAKAFVNGEALCSHLDWEPKILIRDGNVTIRQSKIDGDFGRWRHFKNEWTLGVGTLQPLTLYANAGAGQTVLTLGGLPITNLFLDCGAGEMKASFDRINPQLANLIKLNCGAGHIQVNQLLNVNAELIKIEIGAGHAEVDFTGEMITRDIQAKINVGVGQAMVAIKRDIPARIECESGWNFLNKLHIASAFRRVSPTQYQTPDFATTTAPKLTLHIQSGMGSVEVTTI